jgi:hypothetical protein
MTADAWVPPADAVCCEEGCTRPVTGLRPSRIPYTLQDDSGRVLATYPAGELDETVCDEHAEEN